MCMYYIYYVPSIRIYIISLKYIVSLIEKCPLINPLTFLNHRRYAVDIPTPTFSRNIFLLKRRRSTTMYNNNNRMNGIHALQYVV